MSSAFPCLFKGPGGCPHFLIKSHPRTVALETRELIQQRGWASSPCLDFGGRWGHSALLKGEFSARPAEKPTTAVSSGSRRMGSVGAAPLTASECRAGVRRRLKQLMLSWHLWNHLKTCWKCKIHSKYYSNEQTSSESLRQPSFPSGLFIKCWWICKGATRLVTDLE